MKNKYKINDFVCFIEDGKLILSFIITIGEHSLIVREYDTNQLKIVYLKDIMLFEKLETWIDDRR